MLRKSTFKHFLTLFVLVLFAPFVMFVCWKFSGMLFTTSRINRGLAYVGIVRRYSISGFWGCLFTRSGCSLNIKDISIALGQGGYINIPRANASFEPGSRNNTIFLRILRDIPVRVAFDDADKFSLVLVPSQDIIIKADIGSNNLSMLSKEILLTHILLNNQLLGVISGGGIFADVQFKTKTLGQSTGGRGGGASSSAQTSPPDAVGQFNNEFGLHLRLKIKAFEHADVGGHSTPELLQYNVDGLPLDLSLNLKDVGSVRRFVLSVASGELSLNANLALNPNHLEGEIFLSSWKPILDNITNFIIYLNANAGGGVANEDILACYKLLYGKIIPNLLLRQTPSSYYSLASKVANGVLVKVATIDDRILLNGIAFDYLLNM